MENMKTIFDLQSSEAYPEMKSLHAYLLPKLKHVWSNGSPDIVHQPAPNLRSLSVTGCSTLTHIFNIGEKEDKKEEHVQDGEIKEQVEKESKNEEEKPILLPGLTNLNLGMLPKLSSITPESYTLNWSSITALYVAEENKHLIPTKYI